MSEFHYHFVKLNSTHFAEAPVIFYGIISMEILLSLILLICQPFVCYALVRTGVMHRNFRIQACFVFLYYTMQTFCRFILLCYELSDIPNSKEDQLLFWVETIRDAIICYFCAIPSSFALERFVATHYWYWYEASSLSTLWVFVFVELYNTIPAFTGAYLLYTGDQILKYWSPSLNFPHYLTGQMDEKVWEMKRRRPVFRTLLVAVGTKCVSNITSFSIFVSMLFIGLLVFFRTYLLNLRTLRRISQGATINFYSVSRSFQVQENVEIMTYMYKLAFSAVISGSIPVTGLAINLFGPIEWRFARNVAYAFFDLGIVITGATCTVLAAIGNQRIYNEFKKIYPISALYAYARSRTRMRERTITMSFSSERDMHFLQLARTWDA